MSPQPATRFPVRYPHLRSTLPVAAENRFREPTLAAPSLLHRNAGIGLPRICQNRVPPAVGSGVGKRDGRQAAPNCRLESKAPLDAPCACPSPYGDFTIKHSQRKLFSDFHPGLLASSSQAAHCVASTIASAG